MKAEQEAIFNMFRDTHNVSISSPANIAFVGSILEMQNGFTRLGTFISTISGLASLQAQVLSGIGVDKNQLKDIMAKNAFNYSGPGRAWAASNNDDTTYDALNISITKIKQARDDQAGPIAQNMYNILNANAALLTPFGLIAAQLNELLGNINGYTASVPLPASAINLRQTYTQNIIDQIRDGSDFLERILDNIVRGQINNNPDFITTYFNNRAIIDPPRQSTTFNILVLDDVTGNPIGNAKAEAVGFAKFAFTDADGKCALKQFKKGFYSILVTATGFNPSQQDNIDIGLGDTKDLVFRLIRL